MRLLLAMVMAISLYAAPKQQIQLSADEALLNEIEVVLDKLSANNESINKNSDEIKRLKRVNKEIFRDNEMLLDEVSTKCKALNILNSDVASGVCTKVKKHSKSIEKSKTFSIKIDDKRVLKKYPHIAKQLFTNGLVEFQVRKINGEWIAKRRGYSMPLRFINKQESGMLVMVKHEAGKFYAVSYKYKNMKNYKAID
jgi:archaellum component FlaC